MSPAEIYTPHVPAYGDPLEHAIARGLLRAMAAADFVAVAVWDSEEYVYAGKQSGSRKSPMGEPAAMTEAEVLDAVFAVDSNCTIHFAPASDRKEWGALGVMVIQGNGPDFISDYHCRNKAFTAAIDSFCAALDGGAPLIFVSVPGAPSFAV